VTYRAAEDAAGPAGPPPGLAGRPRLPDAEGFAERGGVKTAWASYGSGSPTLVLLPTWSIVTSRFWKAQVPYLARRFRVVTFDGRGSGGSDRPPRAADHTDEQYAADTLAVLDELEIEQAVLVGFSCGVTWALHVAATHPERVLGLVALAPSCGLGVADPHRDAHPWDGVEPDATGWASNTRDHWLSGGYPAFLEFFFGRLFSEPHSTKQIEDCVGWGLDLAVDTAIATKEGRAGFGGAVCSPVQPLCRQVRCPVSVVHGTADEITPYAVGQRLAELTGGTLLTVEGAGHGLPARHPVLVNREIRRFAEQIVPPVAPRRWTRAPARPKRVLYVSSPIGLGHARRDLAIADELRNLHPGLQIDWLAQHPVTRVLADAGESIHPASTFLASESAHVEEQAAEHDLHAFTAIRRMDEILVNNFGVFADLVAEESYDLVVGDEAWDIDYFLHENPELKRFAYAWFTDFVGWLPMPDGGPAEAALTSDYNAEMLEQRARFRRLRDRSIFVGNPDDVTDATFGPDLPQIRGWTEQNFDFAGYVTGFEPIGQAERERLRRKHGYRADEQVCLVTVGGSGVGGALLRRVLDAVPLVRRAAPDLRFVVVAGPRIDPRSLPRRRGASVVGYLPDLYEHLAACDVAVVQGGLTTGMELAAGNRPFLYVPLRHHFEQNFHVRRRLENYTAGTCLDYELACDPAGLAAALLAVLDSTPHCRPVESGGARRAAAMLAELV
jgi:pimeloyl-ACP methyl ester carboxylesterase/predicted glycosyltransferase